MPDRTSRSSATGRATLDAQAIRFQRPAFPSTEAVEHYFAMAREERWFSNSGPCATLLGSRLTAATGRPCVVVANATLGLIVALAALRRRGPQEAFEALVPSFAFAASAQAAVWNGLAPVFVDVAPGHWHLDPAALERALSLRRGRVAAVVALSSFGVPPPPAVRRRWEELCAEAGVPLLVDSAAGFGARAADGVAVGAQGDAEVVSFHATKPLAAGEGGAVFCRDEELAAEVAHVANFSFDSEHRALHAHGINAKMSELAAAAALAGLDELDRALSARRQRAERLQSLLPADFERQLEHRRGTWQFIPVAAPDAAARRRVLDGAAARGVTLRTYYEPLHAMPGFASCEAAGELEVTNDLGARILSLPMAVDLDDAEIGAVASAVVDGARLALTA